MNHTIFYLSTLFFLFFSSTLNAQVIFGTVYDGDNGTPLSGASVLIQHSTHGTFTDTAGKFELQVPAGEHTIVVSFVGFERFTSKPIKVNAGDRKKLKVNMVSANVMLDEVVVTGYGIKKTKKGIRLWCSFKYETRKSQN